MKLRGAIALALALATGRALAYPLDGFPETGIARLEAYRLAQEGKIRARTLPSGARHPSSFVRLRLAERPELALPAPDPVLGGQIRGFLGEEADRYGVALLDLSDPAQPRYAEHNAGMVQNPGSVGKLIVATAWFQALADLYPEDLEARRRLMRDTVVAADEFIHHDHHTVPFWSPGDVAVVSRPLALGDRGNVWTYLDWMCSSSSNAAASVLMSQLVLLKHFGLAYPVPAAAATAFLNETTPAELSRIFLDAIRTPVSRNGLDLERLRQGSFFTREGKRRIPGTNSVATSRELMRLLVRMEQGVLVDPFSSLEIKRLLYLTDRRIRYASHPVLGDAAVYFKSGSLYSCAPEPGFTCRKYHGNVKNYMSSVAIVETAGDEGDPPLHYIAVVMSNVLRKNSAVAHQTLALRIHRLIEGIHPAPEEAAAPAADGGD